ncbi:hypothetical protein [Streptomyces sp. NPDC002520]
MSRPVRERLASATAEYNNCEYCLSAHTFIGAHVGKADAEELERARDGESADPHTAAPPALSGAVASGRGSIDDTRLKAARAAGVTDAETAQVVGNPAPNVLTDYFSILADTDTDSDTEWPIVPARPRLTAGRRRTAQNGSGSAPIVMRGIT